MSEHDIKALILWFKNKIKVLENSDDMALHYGKKREGVNRLVGFVEVLEGEVRDGQSR